MRSRVATWWLVGLPVLTALLGYQAGPWLAGTHRTVRLARQVQIGPAAQASDERVAFRRSGRKPDDLYGEARQIEARFRRGGGWLGLWCGFVVALKAWGVTRRTRRAEYETDAGECLACGRCYLFCPRERLRLKRSGL